LKHRRMVIIGPGRWGHALGQTFETKSFEIKYLGRDDGVHEWNEAFSEASDVLLACPFSAVDSNLKKLRNRKNIRVIVNASKGIDHKSLKTFSQLGANLKVPTATLSGPSFAQELADHKPTACVLAGRNKKLIQSLCKELSTPWFRLYAHTDSIGVELCGAIKNVLAIASGVSDALNLGQNARAALLSRGLVEMAQLVQHFGGKPASVIGLAGVGDLWLTATGDLSRNRRFGLRIGRGESTKRILEDLVTVEGVYTVSQIHKISRRGKLDLPICESVYRLCTKGSDPKQELQKLMKRSLKFEESSRWKLSYGKNSSSI